MKKTKEEKTREIVKEWVSSFKEFKTSMLQELYMNNPDSWDLIHPECDSSIYSPFPMWGDMWQFENESDKYWLESHIDTMIDCGFCIYKHEEYGYFFGINGAGYSFIDDHFTPLYKIYIKKGRD